MCVPIYMQQRINTTDIFGFNRNGFHIRAGLFNFRNIIDIYLSVMLVTDRQTHQQGWKHEYFVPYIITVVERQGFCFQTFYLSNDLSVCPTLRINTWTDFHGIINIEWAWHKKQCEIHWGYSGSPPRYRVRAEWGGIHACEQHSGESLLMIFLG